MELYRFNAKGKNGKMYTNLVLTWSYKGKSWRVYMRPSFFNDVKVVLSRATKVKSFEDCKQVYHVQTYVHVYAYTYFLVYSVQSRYNENAIK